MLLVKQWILVGFQQLVCMIGAFQTVDIAPTVCNVCQLESGHLAGTKTVFVGQKYDQPVSIGLFTSSGQNCNQFSGLPVFHRASLSVRQSITEWKCCQVFSCVFTIVNSDKR